MTPRQYYDLLNSIAAGFCVIFLTILISTTLLAEEIKKLAARKDKEDE